MLDKIKEFEFYYKELLVACTN